MARQRGSTDRCRLPGFLRLARDARPPLRARRTPSRSSSPTMTASATSCRCSASARAGCRTSGPPVAAPSSSTADGATCILEEVPVERACADHQGVRAAGAGRAAAHHGCRPTTRSRSSSGSRASYPVFRITPAVESVDGAACCASRGLATLARCGSPSSATSSTSRSRGRRRCRGAGDIVHLDDPVVIAGGGGGIAFFQLTKSDAEVHLFTAIGLDEAGTHVHHEIASTGATIHAGAAQRPHTRDIVIVTPDGERTIFVVGEPLHPQRDDRLSWDELASCDAAYFTGPGSRHAGRSAAGEAARRHGAALARRSRRRACARTSSSAARAIRARRARSRTTRTPPRRARDDRRRERAAAIETAAGRTRFACGAHANASWRRVRRGRQLRRRADVVPRARTWRSRTLAGAQPRTARPCCAAINPLE